MSKQKRKQEKRKKQRAAAQRRYRARHRKGQGANREELYNVGGLIQMIQAYQAINTSHGGIND